MGKWLILSDTILTSLPTISLHTTWVHYITIKISTLLIKLGGN
jgi:hypothetical protein